MVSFVFTASVFVSGVSDSGMSAMVLPFSIFKLILFTCWVYLCLYLVQYVEFSLLVPKKFKTVGKIGTLLTGPICLLLFVVIKAAIRASESGLGMAETIKGQLTELFSNIKGAKIFESRDDGKLTIFDSSGRDISEILTHGKSGGKSPTLKLTEQIIGNALDDRATDILIDPKDGSTYTVRYRVDGVLKVVYDLDTDVCKSVINSIKAVSDMDIADKRRPQDGSFRAQRGGFKVSFRVASAGVIHGEKLSVRVLGRDASQFRLDTIGLSKKQQLMLQRAVEKPSGMILICGPTGSGKTTTMYALLNEIDLNTRNVITVEDPVEYSLPNASQIEINPKADITFAKSLRSILRQDPDVICIGEIRDEETAKIALQASQTGHLVLATIHSNSNAATLLRLMDLGVSQMLLASGLDVIISQRLLRRLCDNCKIKAKLTDSQIHEFRRKKINYHGILDARGCEHCNDTGYYERTAICDILTLNNKLKDTIANSESFIVQLRKVGDKKGQSNMKKQALKKIVGGLTNLKELHRVLG